MMFGITDLGVFVAGTVAIVLLPGPNSLYVLTVTVRGGLRLGYAGAAGIFLGDTALMLLTALGAASVMQAHPLLYSAVRWAGAAYLGYLGVVLLVRAWQAARAFKGRAPASVRQFVAALEPLADPSAASVCRKALLISLLNPKAILFFLSFFVQFVDPTYAHPALTFLLLGVIVQITSLLYLSGLIFGGARLAQAFAAKRHLSALLNATVGLLFIGFGLRLAA